MTTRAEDCLNKAKHDLQDGAEHLSHIIVHRCEGWEEFNTEAMQHAFNSVLEARELLD